MTDLRKALKKTSKMKSLSKAQTTAESRLATLEGAYSKLIKDAQQSFSEVAKDNGAMASELKNVGGLMSALLQVLGEDTASKVYDKFKENRIAEIEKEADVNAARVKVLAAEGKIKSADVVTEASLVCLTQKTKTGELKHPAKNYLPVENIAPAVKELILGKKAGEAVTLPEGDTLEVIEVYSLVDLTQDQKLPEATFGVNPEQE